MNSLVHDRAELLYENVSDIIDGRLDVGHPPSPDYADGLIYGYSILNRSISRVYHTFKNHREYLRVDHNSVEATIEDLVGVYGIYIPGGDQLLKEELLLIEDLNFELKRFQI